ncbi:MAG: hypothetical protein ACREBH_03740 [Candidatus Micrarchaeaceae archaeon]
MIFAGMVASQLKLKCLLRSTGKVAVDAAAAGIVVYAASTEVKSLIRKN